MATQWTMSGLFAILTDNTFNFDTEKYQSFHVAQLFTIFPIADFLIVEM